MAAARAALLLLPLFVLAIPAAHARKWPAIPPEELGLERPAVDVHADAEALFWDVRVEDSFSGSSITTELWHHVRIKVFTERGCETQSRVDLHYDRGQQIDVISGRSVSPRGEVAELASREIYERTVVRGNDRKVRVKSFVIPRVEVGSIVEYRWREFRGSRYRFRGLFELQRDIPVQRLTYHVKPIEIRGAPPLQMHAFNTVLPRFESEGFGFHRADLTRVPAFVEEPSMPPEREVRRWMVMYYAPTSLAGSTEIWAREARELAGLDDDLRKAGRDLRKAAAEIVGETQDPEEQLRRLYAFCRTRIKNLESRASGITEEERSRLRPNDDPRKTLSAKQGTGDDVQRLFAALASGAGYDVRSVRTCDREYFYFHEQTLPWLLAFSNIAVRVGDGWRFFDVANSHVPFGMLRWQEENVTALVQDKGEPLWLRTPLSPSARSAVERSGGFRLLADGTLEGEGRLEYSGHIAIEERVQLEESSLEEWERGFRDRMAERFPGGEVSDIRTERTAESESTLVLRYRLRAPDYAKASGKRLFLKPAVFQAGRQPRFLTSTRRNGIDFHYPWSERDSLTIELPEGYVLDHPDRPGDVQLEGACRYQVVLGTTHGDTRLIYRRRLTIDHYSFDHKAHSTLKETFDAIHERDQHALAIRQGTSSGP